MTITLKIRQKVRQRGEYACEYCGITESDMGDQLTIDHYQPQTKGGNNDLENLVYSCIRCNQYKSDYWPPTDTDIFLWNPRKEKSSQHFITAEDGTLHALTTTGRFTIKRLHLNRKHLIQSRLNKVRKGEELDTLLRYSQLVESLEQLNTQLSDIVKEQQELLQSQQELLKLLLGSELWE